MTGTDFCKLTPFSKLFSYSKRDFTNRYLRSENYIRSFKKGTDESLNRFEAARILIALSCCESPRELEEYAHRYLNVKCSMGYTLSEFVAKILESPERASRVKELRINRNDVEAFIQFNNGNEALFYETPGIKNHEWKVKNEISFNGASLANLSFQLNDNESGEIVNDIEEYMYNISEHWEERKP